MWVLIVVTTVSASMTGESVSVALQEFDDQFSCQQAERRVVQMVNKASVAGNFRLQTDCLPKGAPAAK